MGQELSGEDGFGGSRVEGFLLDDDSDLLLEVESGELQGRVRADPVHHDLSVDQLVGLWGLNEVLLLAR